MRRFSPYVCQRKQHHLQTLHMNRFAVTAQGWREENDENISNDLTQLDLIVRRRSDCDKKYEKNLSPSIINYWFPNMTISSMFCASSNLKTEGTC